MENPLGHRPERSAAVARHLRRQPPRQPGASAPDPRHPTNPVPPRTTPQAARQTSRRLGVRLRSPAATAPSTWRHAPHRPQRNRVLATAGAARWVVERTVSWLAGCRRLHRRYERKPEHFLAFVDIAATLICHRRRLATA
ncbi:transposase [Streptomyces sp. NBC_01799]|nr:transposase [Streptomyces sp. NBC_01800]WSA82599.1 transposase [Streptomyces sp. NBC_01799]